MSKVDIIIATYNGEKYLRQQLLSILAQDFGDWRVLIHDDGSTDATIKLIEEFCNKDPRFNYIDDGVHFKSPAKNFMHLLSHTTSQYVCFCDQDDIWIENKLSVLINAFKESTIPTVLVSSGYLFTDKGNAILGKLDYHISNLSELLFVNGGIHGSRCMINTSMREEMLRYSGHLNMHDHLMAQIACSFGNIEYLDLPLFFYRQHSGNVTGNIIVNPFKRIVKAFSSISTKFLIAREIYDCNKQFQETYFSKLSNQDHQLIKEYLQYPNYSFYKKVITLIRYRFSIGSRGRCHLLIKALTRKCFDK